MNKKNIISFVLLLLLTSSLSAKNYHVDGSVIKSGNGSKMKPFKTIAEAAVVLKKGETCFIHAGIYREEIAPKQSGAKNKPIVFTNFNNEQVIVSATQQINGWKRHSGNIYKTSGVDLPLELANNVYCNGEKMQIARWPNDSDNDEYSLDAKFIDKTKGNYSMSFIRNDEIPNFDWTGGTIHYLGAHSGCSWERKITNFNQISKKIYFKILPEKWPFGKTHSPYRMENDHRGVFYLMDKLEALDAPREWYYDASNKTLYFYAPDGKNPNSSTVEIAVRTNTVQMNVNHVQLNGLNFFGGMVSINGNYNRISNCMVKHGVERLVTNLNGAAVSEAAIQLMSGQHNTIEKCVVENGTVNGLYLSSKATDNHVENCIIQNFNTIGIHAYLIGSRGDRNTFYKNSMYGSARDGVSISGDNSEFAYNHVQKCLISGADGGLFYVCGNSIPRNIEVHHNWFHDAYADTHAGKKATGIYLDNNSAGYIVHHNVVWDVEWAGLHFNWNAVENQIYNNTFWNVGPYDQAMIDCWVPKRNEVQTDVSDNILYNNLCDVRPWWNSGDGTKYRIDDKEYLGPEADNTFKNNHQFMNIPFQTVKGKMFVPNTDSPAIDEGIIIKGITDNYKGKHPDLGAYEAEGKIWIPGVDWEPIGFAWLPCTKYKSLKFNGK